MKIVLSLLVSTLIICPLYPQWSKVEKANEFYSRGMEYYVTKNYDSLIYYMNSALQLRPDHPRILYNLAAGYALNGKDSKAIEILDKIAGMKLYYPVQDDSDFVDLINTDKFKEVREKFDYNFIPVINSTTAFRLHEKGLLTEGIAYDRETNRFFISSVHKRKILENDGNGRITQFNSDKDTLLGIFGMRVDEKHRKLWAVGGAIKNMAGYKKGMKGESFLYDFNIDTGELLGKHKAPEKNEDHLFGDLTLDSAGNVFISDSRYNVIYKLPFGGDNLETAVPAGYFVSLQGIAFNEKESLLYAADYSQGIFKINLQNKEVSLLKNESTTTLLGIDGLYFYKGKLVATQNGVNPQRILLLSLDPVLSSVSSYEILESNNPQFDEPTLGIISGDTFYFIANSQWARFNDNGTIYPDERLEYPLILKIGLE